MKFPTAMILIGLVFAPGQPATAQPETETSPPVTHTESRPGWLGVWVEPLPDALRSQLAPLLGDNEGLLVVNIEADSPARQAGIQTHDVLISFDEQKLYTPAQLASLVSATSPDRPVEVSLIHRGKIETLTTMLAPRPPRILAQTRRPPARYLPMRPMPPPPSLPYSEDLWDHFEQVEVKKLPNGRYRASISFRDRADESHQFTFEGDRREIIDEIQQLEDLPADKKRALLRALNWQPGQIDDLHDLHELTRELLQSPWFQRPWFERRFLRDPFALPPEPYYPYYHSPYPWDRPPVHPPWQLHLYPEPPLPHHRR